MSAAALFDAARALKRELTGNTAIGLDQDEVDAFNAVIARWQPTEQTGNPTSLSDAAAFFSSIRSEFGSLDQEQVDGFQALLQAFGVASWPLGFAAYGLATAWHETNETMKPVREAYWLTDAWRKANLKYYPWYGRGYVELTWQLNYVKADAELGLNGALIANPDKALEPAIAAEVMVRGMAAGWFTGKKLGDYLPARGPGEVRQFTLARYIINGTDKADQIAEYAVQFQTALQAGGWA